MDQKRLDALKEKTLCRHCVGESYLSDEIKAQGMKLRCSYCGRVAKSYRIGKLAERIEEVFDEHYIRTPDEPPPLQSSMMSDKESSYDPLIPPFEVGSGKSQTTRNCLKIFLS
jgi:hypothetical protein